MLFRALDKRDDLEAAISVLCTLKGVSPAFASVVLVAFRPEKVPYMSDEALLSMPDCDEVDYTMKEYNKLLGELTICQQRLNSQGGNWGLHSIDKALLSYFILREHKPELLKDMPEPGQKSEAGDQPEVEKLPEVEKQSEAEQQPEKSPRGEKRPLDDEDEDSQDSVVSEASEVKRPRAEEGEAESPHKANLSGQLIAC